MPVVGAAIRRPDGFTVLKMPFDDVLDTYADDCGNTFTVSGSGLSKATGGYFGTMGKSLYSLGYSSSDGYLYSQSDNKFNLATVDWVLEIYFKSLTFTANAAYIFTIEDTSHAVQLIIDWDSGNAIYCDIFKSGGGTYRAYVSHAANTACYLVISRSGNALSFKRNGVAFTNGGSQTITTAIATLSNYRVGIGGYGNGGVYNMRGYIDEVSLKTNIAVESPFKTRRK